MHAGILKPDGIHHGNGCAMLLFNQLGA